jgi:hypothetical protein
MFENITYKKKFFVAIGVFILLVLACYKKTFKHTLAAKQELNEVESKRANMESVHSELFYVKNEISSIDAAIGGHSVKPEQVQKKLLNFISGKDVNITSIEDVHVFSDEQFIIYTNQIIVEGTYSKLTTALYDIEKRFNDSRVASVNFYIQKDYKRNTDKLYLKLILQNYAGKK